MKTLFIETKRKNFGKITKNLLNLPNKIHIIYTIQYKDFAEDVKNFLKKNNFKIIKFEQVLGCSEITPKADLLLITDGNFHSFSIANINSSEMYKYENQQISRISKFQIKNFLQQDKAKLSKFYYSDNIGLLVSIKPGQNRFSKALEYKEQLEKKFPGKSFYLFLSDNINLQEIENFQIDLFLNFACPGIEFDHKKFLNYKKLKIKIL